MLENCFYALDHLKQLSERTMIRKARVQDVEAIVNLINYYAERGDMLPRSQSQVYGNIRDFAIVEIAGELKGCGALHVVWEDLGEIRSLAIAESIQGHGYGRAIVEFLLQEAPDLGLQRVLSLTYKPKFFEKLGFKQVPKETLPHKIWSDCINCPHFPNCNEVALLRYL